MRELPPRVGSFEEAWSAGRRRLHHRLAGLGGIAVGGVATIIVVLLTGANVPTSLIQRTDVPGAGTSAAPQGSPTRGPVRSALADLVHRALPGVTSGSPSPAGSTAAATGDPAASAPTSSSPPSPGATSEPTATAPATGVETSQPPQSRHTYTVVRDDVAMPSSGCAPANQPTAPWCLQFPGPFTSPSGKTQTYAALMCRPSAAGPATMRFTSTLEMDFSIRANNRLDWSSATGVSTKSGAHTVTVGAGRCARWQVDWDTYDDNGEILPVSSGYAFQASVNWSGDSSTVTNSASSGFTIN